MSAPKLVLSLLLCVAGSLAWGQVGLAGDSTAYAMGMSRYHAADYVAARPLLLRAANRYESTRELDSAALAVYHYGMTYAKDRAVAALTASLADTLAPLLRRLDTPLARALTEELNGEVAYWNFDWEASRAAYQRAFVHYDTTDATAVALAAVNRRSLGYLQMAFEGVDSMVYFGRWSLRLAAAVAPACSREVGYAHLGLGNFHFMVKEHAAAIAHTQMAFSALDAVLPPGHPDRSLVYSQLADCQLELGRVDEALESLRRSRLHARSANANTRYLATTEYADLLRQIGLYEESLHWTLASLGHARRAYGVESPFQVAPLLGVATSATEAGATETADRYLDTAAVVIAAHAEATGLVAGDYYTTRGRLALERGDLVASRTAYLEALRIAEERYEPHARTVRIGLHNVANVLLELGSLDSAAKYYARLADITAEDGEATYSSVERHRLGARLATARGGGLRGSRRPVARRTRRGGPQRRRSGFPTARLRPRRRRRSPLQC